MTKISIRSGGGRHILTAQGHAAGSVEVCAAISGILYALEGFLLAEESAKLNRRRMESADVLLDCSGGERVEAAYEVAAAGLARLTETYPALVDLEIEENEKTCKSLAEISPKCGKVELPHGGVYPRKRRSSYEVQASAPYRPSPV